MVIILMRFKGRLGECGPSEVDAMVGAMADDHRTPSNAPKAF